MSTTPEQYGRLHFELWRIGVDAIGKVIGIAAAPDNSVSGASMVRFISTDGLDVECETEEAIRFLGSIDDNAIESVQHFVVLLCPEDEVTDPRYPLRIQLERKDS
jgi:hypothetical protein